MNTALGCARCCLSLSILPTQPIVEISDPSALDALRKSLEGKRGRGRVTLVVPMPDESQAEVVLPGSYAIAGGLRDVIGSLPGIAQVEEI